MQSTLIGVPELQYAATQAYLDIVNKACSFLYARVPVLVLASMFFCACVCASVTDFSGYCLSFRILQLWESNVYPLGAFPNKGMMV